MSKVKIFKKLELIELPLLDGGSVTLSYWAGPNNLFKKKGYMIAITDDIPQLDWDKLKDVFETGFIWQPFKNKKTKDLYGESDRLPVTIFYFIMD